MLPARDSGDLDVLRRLVLGHTVGTGHRNVETRTHQYRASFDPQACLALARGWVAAKIANGRTLLRRNWRLDDGPPDALLAALKDDLERVQGCEALDRLLGVEGAAAARYFGAFSALLKPAADTPGRSTSRAATAGRPRTR